MNETAKSIINVSSALFKSIREYILSNKNWLYYFVADKEVFLLIYEHPDDWADYVELKIESLKECAAYVTVDLGDEYGDFVTVKRWVTISTFEMEVDREYRRYKDNALSHLLKEKEDELKFFQSRVDEVKKQINKLKIKYGKN